MALTDSLVAWWDFLDDSTSGEWPDAHTNGYVMYEQGNGTFAQEGTIAKGGNALKITGGSTTTYLKATSNQGLLDPTADHTIAGWIRVPAITDVNTLPAIYSQDDGSGTRDIIFAQDRLNNGNGYFRYYLTTSSSLASAAMSTDTWYFFVGWYDASAETIYLQVNNGTPSSIARSTFTTSNTSYPTIAGTYNTGIPDAEVYYFAQCAIWSRTLTAQERTDLYNSGDGIGYPGGSEITLTAAQGSYTLSGQDTEIQWAAFAEAAQGSYTLTGQDATLAVGQGIVAEQGAYTLAGQDATLAWAATMTAGQGSHTLTGYAVNLLKGVGLTVDSGAYTLAGKSAYLGLYQNTPAARTVIPELETRTVSTDAETRVTEVEA